MGKSLLRIELKTANDEFWTDLRQKNRNVYLEEKRKIADEVINILDKKLNGIKDKIDMIDVATPATFVRYTGNWRGSIQGWQNENIFKRNPFRSNLREYRISTCVGSG